MLAAEVESAAFIAAIRLSVSAYVAKAAIYRFVAFWVVADRWNTIADISLPIVVIAYCPSHKFSLTNSPTTP